MFRVYAADRIVEQNSWYAFEQAYQGGVYVACGDLTGDGVPELKTALAAMMPVAEWMYPEDQVSDASERLLAAEITREQLYRQLHDSFGGRNPNADLGQVMKQLLAIKEAQN